MVEPSTAIIAASRVAGEACRGLKAGSLKVCRWMAQKEGLATLKKLPTGLQAMVFGDDLSAELLAVLSLGGSPGMELATLALMHNIKWGVRRCSHESGEIFFEDAAAREPPDIHCGTRMSGGLHEVELLGSGHRKHLVHIHEPEPRALWANANRALTVVGFAYPSDKCGAENFSRGLIVVSSADDHCWYCENRCGTVKYSPIGLHRLDRAVDVNATREGSQVFTVNPSTLSSYAEFDRIFALLTDTGGAAVVPLLGLAKLAEDLARSYVDSITNGDCDLLSSSFLEKKQGSGDYGLLQIPPDILSQAREKGQALPLSDRQYERTCFHPKQKIISDFLEEVRGRAMKSGNVGCQPYDMSTRSLLIRSCILDAMGKSSTYAIFQGFKESKLNIAVSSGCTSVYFPGLNLTLAFPGGSDASQNASFRAACPFMPDLSLTLPILVDLAPKIAEGRLTKVARKLSAELAAEPSLALSPLTENVLRSFSTMEVRKYLLSDLFSLTTGLHNHSEAAVGGVLCQLGFDFTSSGSSPEMKCFFDRCREVGWGRSCGTVGEIVVNCRVNVESCSIGVFEHGIFLVTESPGDRETERRAAKITGPIRDEWLRNICEGYVRETFESIIPAGSGTEESREANRFRCALEHQLLGHCLERETSLLEAITSQPIGSDSVHRISTNFYVG